MVDQAVKAGSWYQMCICKYECNGSYSSCEGSFCKLPPSFGAWH